MNSIRVASMPHPNSMPMWLYVAFALVVPCSVLTLQLIFYICAYFVACSIIQGVGRREKQTDGVCESACYVFTYI